MREVFGTDVMVGWNPPITGGDEDTGIYQATFTVPYSPKDKDYDDPAQAPPLSKRRPIEIVYSVSFTSLEISEDSLDKQWFVSFAPEPTETQKVNQEWPSEKLQLLFSGNMSYARRNLGPELASKVFSGVVKAVSTFLHIKAPVVFSWSPFDPTLRKTYDMIVHKVASEFPNYGWARSGTFIRKDKADDPAVKVAVGYHEEEPMTFVPPPRPKAQDRNATDMLQKDISFDDVPF